MTLPNLDPNLVLAAMAALVTAIGGLYGAIRHVNTRIHKRKEKYRLDILTEAKEEIDSVREALESKIDRVEAELKNTQEILKKELDHTKEIYSNETKALGEKIESLRSDLQQQHQALIGLLTKLVGSK